MPREGPSFAKDENGVWSATVGPVEPGAYRLGMRLQVRARLRDFDAICRMVAAGVGVAVVPEAAAKRCAQTMPIALLAIRDSWANRQLTICARSFKSLPKPAKLLVDHLRKAAR